MDQPAAIIYVDGLEVHRCEEGADYRDLYETTKRSLRGTGQHEFALCVWKPRHGIYLRERLDIC